MEIKRRIALVEEILEFEIHCDWQVPSPENEKRCAGENCDPCSSVWLIHMFAKRNWEDNVSNMSQENWAHYYNCLTEGQNMEHLHKPEDGHDWRGGGSTATEVEVGWLHMQTSTDDVGADNLGPKDGKEKHRQSKRTLGGPLQEGGRKQELNIEHP